MAWYMAAPPAATPIKASRFLLLMPLRVSAIVMIFSIGVPAQRTMAATGGHGRALTKRTTRTQGN